MLLAGTNHFLHIILVDDLFNEGNLSSRMSSCS